MLLSALTRSAKTLADRVRAEPEADYMINQHRGRSIEPCTYVLNPATLAFTYDAGVPEAAGEDEAPGRVGRVDRLPPLFPRC